MNKIAEELLAKVADLENAAQRGIEMAKDPVPGIPAENAITAEQCEWTLKDCRLFRSFICHTFELRQ